MNPEYTRALREAKRRYVEKVHGTIGELRPYDYGVLEGLEWSLDTYYEILEEKNDS